MDHLGVADCATILAQIAKNVPRAKFVRFRPVDAAFGDAVLDVKAQLEFSLRAFTVLTVGDVIPLSVRGRHARVEVIDVRPVSKAMVSECVLRAYCLYDGYRDRRLFVSLIRIVKLMWRCLRAPTMPRCHS